MLRCFILTSVFTKQEKRECQYPLQLAPTEHRTSLTPPLYQRLPQHIQMLLAIQRQHQTHCYQALAPFVASSKRQRQGTGPCFTPKKTHATRLCSGHRFLAICLAVSSIRPSCRGVLSSTRRFLFPNIQKG